MFSWCLNGLPVDCRNACWWILSIWFLGRRVSPDDARHFQYPASPWPVVPLWISAPVCPCSAILVVSISCYQYWPCKDFWRLAFFIGYSKNGGAEIKRRFHRWELGANVMGERVENWALLSWHWSVNSANNEGFSYSQLRTHFPYPGLSAETSTKHL